MSDTADTDGEWDRKGSVHDTDETVTPENVVDVNIINNVVERSTITCQISVIPLFTGNLHT